MFILPPLVHCKKLPVDQGQDNVGREEEQQLSVDELVEGSLPLEEDAGEATGSGAGHIALVRDGHGSLCLVTSRFEIYPLGQGFRLVLQYILHPLQPL